LLRYFRINDPYRLLGVLGLMTVMLLPFFLDQPPITYPEMNSILVGEKVSDGRALYTQVVDSTAPLAGWFDGLWDILFGRSLTARRLVASFIIFFQAVFLGFLFIDRKAYNESSYLPSALFVILYCFSFDTLALTPELLGSGFLLLALNSLFKEIEFREPRNEPVFNLGLFIGLASLFAFSFIVFVGCALVVLALYTRNTLRKFLLMLFGVFLPHGVILSIYFLKGGLHPVIEYFYLPNLSFSSAWLMSTRALLVLGSVPLFYMLISFVILNREARFTKYQSQLVQVMFFWFVFGFLQGLYSRTVRPQSFVTLLPALSFFIAHFLLMIRRKKIAEVNFWILFIGILIVQVGARYQKLSSVTYDALLVKAPQHTIAPGKTLLALGHDLSAYRFNPVGSAFLNWQLSKEIFEDPAYYEHIITVYKVFREDAPDVILDPDNRMRFFMQRIPYLQQQYRPIAGGYEKVSN
jgi:hypothetical protein